MKSTATLYQVYQVRTGACLEDNTNIATTIRNKKNTANSGSSAWCTSRLFIRGTHYFCIMLDALTVDFIVFY